VLLSFNSLCVCVGIFALFMFSLLSKHKDDEADADESISGKKRDLLSALDDP